MIRDKKNIKKILIVTIILGVFISFLVLPSFLKDRNNKSLYLGVTNEVINNDFYGFGAETLPWLWTKENLKQGINEDDIKLNIKRIKEMELPLTRIFVPWEIWNPSTDYRTFTFESDGMQSLYKTLDIYQDMGTSVIIVTVDWLRDSPWHDVKKSSRAVLKLLEYLVKGKGYSCVHFWTLTNEPELTYEWLKKMPFENYIQIHRLVKEGLKKRKLSVKIICSDEVESESWFRDSAESLFDSADIFSSHKYLYPHKIESISSFFKDRINIIAKSSKKEMPKPFFLCEFGFRGKDFGTYTNGLMNDFDYGLFTAELCIDALNNRVSGVSIWCLHEIFMPDGKKMKIGLWRYKDCNWEPKPVFYAYSLFTKYIKNGSRVLAIANSSSPHIKVTYIECSERKSIFVLNKSNVSQKVIINGLNSEKQLKKFIYTYPGILIEDKQVLKVATLTKGKGFLKDKIAGKSLILYTNF